MNKLEGTIVIASLTLNVLQKIVIHEQQIRIMQQQNSIKLMMNWMTIAHQLMREHSENGGEFLVDPQTVTDLQAFSLFVENDL